MDIARHNGFQRISELLADASRSRLFASPGNPSHPAGKHNQQRESVSFKIIKAVKEKMLTFDLGKGRP